MNLRFLRTIVAVSQHQSLNAAARSLGLSHSAVSLQIKALEDELQFPILDRTRRPPVLTGEGLALVEHARRMEDIAGDIRSLADGSRLRGRVTVGAVPSTISNLAAPALAGIFAENPDLTVELQSALSQRLIDLVGDGTLDVALVTDPGAGSGDLDIAPICAEPFQVIAAAGEAMDDPDALLAARPFVWFDRRSRLSQQVDAYLSGQGIRVATAMEVDSFEAVEALVRHNLGVSILPRRALADEPEGLARHTLPLGLLQRRVVLVSRTASARRVFAARFAETLRAAVAGA
jgi:DNA-binding transcriptional LysR family regulator